ncbi:hypothetical protein KKE26_03270 [bacterium]|nr:hypothetical protein [bacterium]
MGKDKLHLQRDRSDTCLILNFNDDLAVVSSIKVPAGCKATLYKDINYAGGSLVRTADDSTLVNDNFNDVTSSIKVEGGGA